MCQINQKKNAGESMTIILILGSAVLYVLKCNVTVICFIKAISTGEKISSSGIIDIAPL